MQGCRSLVLFVVCVVSFQNLILGQLSHAVLNHKTQVLNDMPGSCYQGPLFTLVPHNNVHQSKD